MYEGKVYQLQDVLDLHGTSKVDDLYMNRIGCRTTDIKKQVVEPDGSYVMRMNFTQDHNGYPTKKSLRTSIVSQIVDKDDMIEVWTQNSIYLFKEAEMATTKFLDEANIIELYLCDEGYQFCAGFYYDENKRPHELHESVHLGMFQDSVIIYLGDDISNSACRYFPFGHTIEFYDTIYHQQPYDLPMLIHNQGCNPLTIRFEGHSKTWTIYPFEDERIVPPMKKEKQGDV